MQKLKPWLLAAAALTLLSGCNSDDDPAQAEPVAMTSLKVVHAVSDAPAVKLDGGDRIQVSRLDFAGSTVQLMLPAGSYNLKADALLPENKTARVIEANGLNLLENLNYTVFVVGSAANASIQPLVVTAPDTPVTAGNARVQVVHAAAAAPAVDIHLTVPETPLAAGTVTATLDFGKNTAPVQVTAGNYRVRITLPGTVSPVLFDSGTVNLAAGADVTVAAINNRFAGTAPVSLLAVNADGTFADIKDSNSKADVRVVHAVSDAPAVDVLLNNNPAITALKFPDATGYTSLAPASYNVKVAANADNSVVVINADLALTAGSYSTVIATGSLTQNNISPLVLTDVPRRIATEAKLRLVHASSLAGNVDIYLTKTNDISTATASFSNVPFKGDSGYVAVTPGDYVVTVTAAGSKTAAIGPVALSLSGNKIYTAIARDNEGRTAPLGLILLDDFNQM